MRILFMGGHKLGSIALESLINSNKNIIGAIVTDTENKWYKGVDDVALKYEIPLFREKNINNEEFLKRVEGLKPDLIVVVNFDQILKREIINIPTRGCINTHASLLPKYRGRAPLNWAVINGETETGVTVHYIEEGIDTGDIIKQEKIAIKHSDYIEDILEKVEKMYSNIVLSAVEDIEVNKVIAKKQDLSKGFYCGKRSPKDGQIDWSKSASEIYNMIRAVSKPYPGTFTFLQDKKIVIWRARIKDSIENSNAEPGTIVQVDSNDFIVKCGNGYINITSFEVEDVNLQCRDKLIYREGLQ